MVISVNDERAVVEIGRKQENDVTAVTVDYSPWVEEFGEGVIQGAHRRASEKEPYEIAIETDGATATWLVSDVDTGIPGRGELQFNYYVGEKLKRSAVWTTVVTRSLDPTGEPPSPYPNILKEMRELADDAKSSATDSANSAEQSAQSASASAESARNSAQSASAAEGFKNDSAQSAQQSAQSATDANRSAQNANESATQAQQSASKAKQDADSIKGLEVTATTLPAGSGATANYDSETGVLHLGIPKGERGDVTREQWLYAFPNGTATGSIASFSDGGDDIPMKSLNVTITPKQAGSGDPSPDNVRPISGTSTANVTVAGKNLVNYNNPTSISGGVVLEDVPFIVGQTYTFSANISNAQYRCRVQIRAFDTHSSIIASTAGAYVTAGQSVCTFTIPSGTARVRACLQSDSSTQGATFNNIQYEVGTTATDYVPYTGRTTPVPLGQTVYGGEVDVTTGVLKTYPYYSSYNGEALTGAWVCDRAVYSEGTTPPTGSQVVDMSGTVATTVQLTPTEVHTLLGTNNVWSDAGDVAVTYRKDPTLALE